MAAPFWRVLLLALVAPGAWAGPGQKAEPGPPRLGCIAQSFQLSVLCDADSDPELCEIAAEFHHEPAIALLDEMCFQKGGELFVSSTSTCKPYPFHWSRDRQQCAVTTNVVCLCPEPEPPPPPVVL